MSITKQVSRSESRSLRVRFRPGSQRRGNFPGCISKPGKLTKQLPWSGGRSLRVRFRSGSNAREFPGCLSKAVSIIKQVPRNEGRSLRARFRSGSQRRGNYPGCLPDAGKLTKQLPRSECRSLGALPFWQPRAQEAPRVYFKFEETHEANSLERMSILKGALPL